MMIHPIAALFPALPEDELVRLADDIKEYGLRQPIVVQANTLLDGRNRLEACKRVKVEPRWTEYKGDDPAAFIISANLHRRHLNESQRALIGAKLANMPQGRREQTVINDALISQATAAKLLNVSEGNLRQAKTILESAPKETEAIERGEKTVGEAIRGLRKARHAARLKEAKPPAHNKRLWTLTKEQTVTPCAALITDPPYGILTEKWEPGKGGIEDITRLWATAWSRCGADTILTFFSQRFMWGGREWLDESLAGAYEFQQLLVWHYPNNKGPQNRKGFKQTWEPIFFYRRKGSTRHITVQAEGWGDGLTDFDAHVAAVPQSNFKDADCKVHPAQKPVSVMAWLVATTTMPGELVCDPFCGSGTTGIAACQLGRRFHGIETEPEYLKLAQGRLSLYAH